MKLTAVLPLCLSLLLSGVFISAAPASDRNLTRLEQKGIEAFAAGDYKKAESQWNRLMDYLNEKLSRDPNNPTINHAIETTWRRLGECSLAEKNYENADNELKQAAKSAQMLQENDPELDKDLQALSANYRLLDLTNMAAQSALGVFAPIAGKAMQDFRPTKVSIARIEKGHHISVLLEEDVIKDLGSKNVSQFGIDKNTSFDLIQGSSGEIELANIVGIRVHAAIWVNIIRSSLKLNQDQRPVALVTAQKMGFSQSVSTPVPDMIYLPILGLISHVKDLFGGQSASPAGDNLQPQLQTVLAPATNNENNNSSNQGFLTDTTSSTTNPSIFAPPSSHPSPQTDLAQPINSEKGQ